jgi:hypothetical protein
MRNTEMDLLQVGNNEGEWASSETREERKTKKKAEIGRQVERIKHQRCAS